MMNDSFPSGAVLVVGGSGGIGQAVATARNTGVAIGGQDCSIAADDAARTGEISAAMLADGGTR